MKKNVIIRLKPDQLMTHPRNMRKFYPEQDMREMADSILAHSGVIEPLIVTAEKEGKYSVIDGNMRLAGARLLGNECPPLDCKIVDMTETDQLLAMATANEVRYDIDPVSEALHYKALRNEGLSIRDISKRTGVYEIRISSRLVLADLDEPIQQMIVNKKLPSSSLVAEALLKLPRETRLSLAKKIADNPGMKITTIVKACENLAEGQQAEKLKRPAVQLSKIEDQKGAVTVKNLKRAMTDTCRTCNQTEIEIGQTPAWSMLAHAADTTCSGCDLKTMRTICESCPLVEFLKNLRDTKPGKGPR